MAPTVLEHPHDLATHLDRIRAMLRHCPRAVERAGKALIQEIQKLNKANPNWQGADAVTANYVYHVFPAEVFMCAQSHERTGMSVTKLQICESNLQQMRELVRQRREGQAAKKSSGLVVQRQLLSDLLDIPNPPAPLGASEFIDEHAIGGYTPCLGDAVRLDVSDWVDYDLNSEERKQLSPELKYEYQSRRDLVGVIIAIRERPAGAFGLVEYVCDIKTVWHELIPNLPANRLAMASPEPRMLPLAPIEKELQQLKHDHFILRKELKETQAALVEARDDVNRQKAVLDRAKQAILKTTEALQTARQEQAELTEKWEKERQRNIELEKKFDRARKVPFDKRLEEQADKCMPTTFWDEMRNHFILGSQLKRGSASNKVLEAETALYKCAGTASRWFHAFVEEALDDVCQRRGMTPAEGKALLENYLREKIIRMENKLCKQYFMHEREIVF